MKFEHFTKFLAAMLKESAAVIDTNDINDVEAEAAVLIDLSEALTDAVHNCNNETELDDIANRIGMYEYVEAWADDESSELHSVALQYVS